MESFVTRAKSHFAPKNAQPRAFKSTKAYKQNKSLHALETIMDL